MKKVAIYVRVSTLEQAEHGYSLDEQIAKLSKYAEAHGWAVYEVYSDGGFSGSNTTRPALERLTSDAVASRFDTVLIYKLDRLSRSQKDTLHLIEDVFLPHGVDLVSMNENFDTSTPFGKAMIGILSVFAQLEREQIKERMALGKIGRAKSGKAMSWVRVPFGYDYDKAIEQLVPNDVQAPIVRQIFSEYLGGLSLTKLRIKLNDEGHIGHDGLWSYRALRFLISNPIYYGFQKFKGQLYEGGHQPLISRETFEETQRELERRRVKNAEFTNVAKPFQSKYMLSGHVKCGYCGAPLESMLGSKRKDGTRLRKYQCVNRHLGRASRSVTAYNERKKCDSPFYLMDDLEAKVVASIAELQADQSVLDSLVAASQPEKLNREPLEARLVEIDRSMKKLSDLYMIDAISFDDLQEKTASFKDEKRGLTAKLENDHDLDLALTKKRVAQLLGGVPVAELPYEKQKNMVDQLIGKVEVTAETLQIHWNF